MAKDPKSESDPNKAGSDNGNVGGDYPELGPALIRELLSNFRSLKADVSRIQDQIALQTSIENGFGALGEAIRNLAPKQNFDDLKGEDEKKLNSIIGLHQKIDFTTDDFGSKWPDIIKRLDDGYKNRRLGR